MIVSWSRQIYYTATNCISYTLTNSACLITVVLWIYIDGLIGWWSAGHWSGNVLANYFQLNHIIFSIAALTALISGLTAVFQSDIKKLVAYSTTSQLGYICLGCGLGNYSAAVFHLFTHAFFKGLLFLSSGVVIHSIDGVLKTYRLGGLNKLLSIGHGLMVSGSLALVGLPFLAGFYSKELIIICTSGSSRCPYYFYYP